MCIWVYVADLRYSAVVIHKKYETFAFLCLYASEDKVQKHMGNVTRAYYPKFVCVVPVLTLFHCQIYPV